MRGLEGRIALVTGGTGLIGRALTRRLAEEGCTVVVASRDASKARAAINAEAVLENSHAFALELDLADEGSIRAALDHLNQTVGLPEILIANASWRSPTPRSFDELDHGDFARLLDVDAAGHFVCARDLVARLSAERPARVVFLSSVYALVGVDHGIYPDGMPPTPVQYATVKAGLLGLTRYLAARWGQSGTRVNAVVAGGVRAEARQPEEFVADYSRKAMLGRMARADEIAAAAAFLASDDSSYITGQCLAVDGGLTAW